MKELTPSKAIEIYLASINFAETVLGKPCSEREVVELAAIVVKKALKARRKQP